MQIRVGWQVKSGLLETRALRTWTIFGLYEWVEIDAPDLCAIWPPFPLSHILSFPFFPDSINDSRAYWFTVRFAGKTFNPPSLSDPASPQDGLDRRLGSLNSSSSKVTLIVGTVMDLGQPLA